MFEPVPKFINLVSFILYYKGLLRKGLLEFHYPKESVFEMSAFGL